MWELRSNPKTGCLTPCLLREAEGSDSTHFQSVERKPESCEGETRVDGTTFFRSGAPLQDTPVRSLSGSTRGSTVGRS